MRFAKDIYGSSRLFCRRAFPHPGAAEPSPTDDLRKSIDAVIQLLGNKSSHASPPHPGRR